MEKLKSIMICAIYPVGVHHLPAVLSLGLFVGQVLNTCVSTMPFSFLPQMMRTFGVKEVDIGYYAGWIATSMFACNIFSSLAWGFLVDKYGSKWCCIASSLCSAVTTFLFGFSYNYRWAFVTRFLQGLSIGWMVAAKAMLYDLTDNTNQSYAMAILSTGYSLGLMVGPVIGGFLALPCEQYQSVFASGSFFDKFKFMLPNLVIALATVAASAVLIFILPDARSGNPSVTRHYRRSSSTASLYGSLGQTPANVIQQSDDAFWNLSFASTIPRQGSLVYLRAEDGESAASGGSSTSHARQAKSSFYLALRSRDLWISCALYFFYTLPSYAFAEVFSVWAATNKTYHGLGYTPSKIGSQLLVAGLALVVVFPVASTRLTQLWGAKKLMVRCSLLLVLVYPAFPNIWLIPDSRWLTVLLSFLLIISLTADYTCFTSINIFVNNSVPPGLVGMANGLGMTASSVARSIAPVLFGGLFSWSLRNVKDVYPEGLGYPLDQYFVFFMFSLSCFVSAVWVSFIPDYLESRREWPEEGKSRSDFNIPCTSQLKVSVNVFSPVPS